MRGRRVSAILQSIFLCAPSASASISVQPPLPFSDVARATSDTSSRQQDQGDPGWHIIHCRRQRGYRWIRLLLRYGSGSLPGNRDKREMEGGKSGCSEQAHHNQTSVSVELSSSPQKEADDKHDADSDGQSDGGHNFLLPEKILRCGLSKPRPQPE